MSPALLIIGLTLVAAAFFAFDLKAARHYYDNSVWLASGDESFLHWWFKLNVAKICGVVLIYAVIAGVVFRDQLHLPSLKGESSRYITKAEKFLAKQQYREAALELRNAIQENADDVEAHQALARTLWKQGFTQEALLEYQTVIRLDPNRFEPHLELGRLALAVNQSDLALTEAIKATELQPEATAPRLLLAKIHTSTGNLAQAIEEYRFVLAKEPDNQGARHAMITTSLTTGDYAQAARIAEDGLRTTPNDTVLAILLAKAFQGLGRSREAEETLRKAADTDPANPEPLLVLGDMQVLTGDFTGAEKSYEAALLRSPDNRKVMNNIAMLIADHGYDLPRAQRLAEQLIRDDPDNPVFADTLGWVCLRQGRGKEAVPLLKMAAVGLPRSPTVRYHLGAALLATGDHVSGRRELAQALSLSRDFTGAAQARTLLASSPAKSR